MRNEVKSQFAGRFAKSALFVVALIVSAYVMTVAMGTTTGSLLGWVALLPLFLAIRILSPWRAFSAGALWGSCLWIFAGASSESLLSVGVGSLAALAAIPALYAFFGARLTRQVGFSPLILALGWVGVEFALQPLSVGGGLLAGTQSGGLLEFTVGRFAGSFLVAFLVAYFNASLLAVLTDVCVSAPRSALRRGLGDLQLRLFPLEGAGYVVHVFSEARPRAPPV